MIDSHLHLLVPLHSRLDTVQAPPSCLVSLLGHIVLAPSSILCRAAPLNHTLQLLCHVLKVSYFFRHKLILHTEGHSCFRHSDLRSCRFNVSTTCNTLVFRLAPQRLRLLYLSSGNGREKVTSCLHRFRRSWVDLQKRMNAWLVGQAAASDFLRRLVLVSVDSLLQRTQVLIYLQQLLLVMELRWARWTGELCQVWHE